MKKKLLFIVLLSAIQLNVAFGQTELVVNGDFETAFTALTPTSWGQGIRAAYIPGWDKKAGVTTIDPATYNNSSVCEWPSGADVFILEKGGSKVFGLMPLNWGSQPAGDVALEQTITVEPGKTYAIACKTLIGQPDAGNPVISFIKVFEQGSTTSAASATSPEGATVETWYNLSTSYTASVGCTSIVVKVGQTYPTRDPWNSFNNRWAYFDNVSVKKSSTAGFEDTKINELKLSSVNSKLEISNARINDVISVYSLTGSLVNSAVVTSSVLRVSLPNKGIYIVNSKLTGKLQKFVYN